MTMLPPDTDNGDLLVEPTCYCPECHGVIPLELMGEMLVGSCMCGRKWYVPPQRITAQYLTAKQQDDLNESFDGNEPQTVAHTMEVAST